MITEVSCIVCFCEILFFWQDYSFIYNLVCHGMKGILLLQHGGYTAKGMVPKSLDHLNPEHHGPCVWIPNQTAWDM